MFARQTKIVLESLTNTLRFESSSLGIFIFQNGILMTWEQNSYFYWNKQVIHDIRSMWLGPASQMLRRTKNGEKSYRFWKGIWLLLLGCLDISSSSTNYTPPLFMKTLINFYFTRKKFCTVFYSYSWIIMGFNFTFDSWLRCWKNRHKSFSTWIPYVKYLVWVCCIFQFENNLKQ